MPGTLAQLTRSMFGHGGGGWVDRWPQFSRLIALKISSFDLAMYAAVEKVHWFSTEVSHCRWH